MYFEVYVRAGHVLDFMKAVPLTVRLVNGIFRYFEQLSFYKDHNIINGVNCRYFRSHGSSHYRLFHVQKQKTCKKYQNATIQYFIKQAGQKQKTAFK